MDILNLGLQSLQDAVTFLSNLVVDCRENSVKLSDTPYGVKGQTL